MQIMSEVKLPVEMNNHIKIWIDGEVYARNEAKISVFDSLVQGGDGVWEGLRVYNGRVFQFEEHLDRMMDSAKVMDFKDIPTRDYIKNAIFETLKANGMRNNAHIRLTLSRGKKVTSGMSPHWNKYGCSLIVIAEWKPPVFKNRGLKLISSTIRRNTPSCLDSKIHHNNLINNILAKIESNYAGVDEAVMLDIEGFVAETNACNIFFVKNGIVFTPFGDACLPGITRKKVLEIANANGVKAEERRVSIAAMYAADEVFITGTMGELTSIVEIDGRTFEPGPVTKQLQELYLTLTKNEGVDLPEFDEVIFKA